MQACALLKALSCSTQGRELLQLSTLCGLPLHVPLYQPAWHS